MDKKLFIILFVLILIGLLNLVNISAVGSRPDCNASNGVVLCYGFNNNSAIGENDTWVVDESGNENSGYANNTQFQAGTGILNDGSMYFNGVNSSIIVNDSDSLANNYTGMTWSFWANRSTYLSGEAYLDKYLTTGNQRSWRIYTTSSTNILLTLSDNLTQGSEYISLNGCGLDNNQWTFITIVYNSSNVIFYKNGEQCDIRTSTTLYAVDNNALMYIGFKKDTNKYFNGSFDDIIIYNRSLSSSEVSANYRNYGGCIIPTKNVIYNSFNYPMCYGIYNFDTYSTYNSTNIIKLNQSNLDFNGQDSTIFYANSSNSYIFGIRASNLNNLTIRNLVINESICSLTKGNHAIYLSNVSNVNLINLTIHTCSLYSTPIYLDRVSNVNLSMSILYNYGVSSSGVYFYNSSESYVLNNLIYSGIGGFEVRGISAQYNNSYLYFLNNIINTNSSYGGNGITVKLLAYNIFINNNTIKSYNGNYSAPINLESNIFNGQINNNNLWSSDSGNIFKSGIMFDTNINNFDVKNNFINVSGQQASGIHTQNDKNLCLTQGQITCLTNNNTFENNTIYTNGYLGYGVFLLGNIFNISYTTQYNKVLNNNIKTRGNYSDGIRFLFSSNNIVNNNIINVTNSTSYNFDFSLFSINNTINNNSLNLNVNSNYVMTSTNKEYDLVGFFGYITGYLFSNFNTSVYFTNTINALVSHSSGLAEICNGDCNITLNPNEYVYVYDNNSVNSTKLWTNVLAFDNSTKQLFLSSNINSNDGYFNNSQLFNFSNNASILLDNYSLTETYRTNSPIWFSSSSNTEKHIASNLSNSVNVTVSFDVKDCDSIGYITYKSNSGLYQFNYSTSTWFHSGLTYECLNNIVTIDNVPIETATSSNEFIIDYSASELSACNDSVDAFMGYVLFIGLLGTLTFLGLVIAYLTGIIDKSQLNKISIISVITTLILVSLLIIIGIFIISTLCGVF